MNNNDLDRLLKLAGLTQKSFADINKLHKNSVSNWKQKGIPEWVQHWLENYIKARAFDEMLELGNKLNNEMD